MSTKNHRASGKVTGSHTTVINLAGQVVDILEICPFVSKISLGFIEAKMGHANGRRVKLTRNGNCILLAVRETMSGQEVRAYPTRNLQETMLAISRALRNADIAICFDKKRL